MVLVEMPHVPEGIYADQAPDDADDKGHDDGELVDKEGRLHRHRRSGNGLKPDDQRSLGKSESDDQVIAEPDGKTEDDDRDRH